MKLILIQTGLAATMEAILTGLNEIVIDSTQPKKPHESGLQYTF